MVFLRWEGLQPKSHKPHLSVPFSSLRVREHCLSDKVSETSSKTQNVGLSHSGKCLGLSLIKRRFSSFCLTKASIPLRILKGNCKTFYPGQVKEEELVWEDLVQKQRTWSFCCGCSRPDGEPPEYSFMVCYKSEG